MKKLIVSISLCALLLCGCQVVLAPGAYDLHSDGLTKAEALHIVPAGSSEVTQVLDDPAELDAFSRILNDAVETDDWAMSSLPHGAVPLGTITYTQAETLKLGQRPEERQMEALCVFTPYQDIPYTTLELNGLRLTLQLPEPSAAALRAYF